MRAALSMIQQTLTAEAAAVLGDAIAEAARRRHGQTTPLHVAAALLASPSGLLRQACVRSHPSSSHPLQCRALELCFSVALDRLPSNASASSPPEPPISNALMAALKRAQAHQRRGCPEQQQQPLLAVKVELDQFVLSILDDPSVSRVMREASFSSPAVKAAIEQSLSISSSASPSPSIPPSPAAAAALNPYPGHRFDEVKRVLDVLGRGQRRNPVLVGDSDPRPILKDVLRRIEAGADPSAPAPLRPAHVLSLEKDLFAVEQARVPERIRELGAEIEAQVGDVGGVVLDLGDLKWLVEGHGLPKQQQQAVVVSETARAVVVEMARLLNRFGDGGSGSRRLWLVGTATCATYLRCQVYHPSVESDWDLQAVPIAPRSPLPHLFPRLGANGILGSSVESIAPLRSPAAANAVACVQPRQFPQSLESRDSCKKSAFCSICMEGYERELAKLAAKEFERSSSTSKLESRQPLPPWLRTAKQQDHSQPKEQELKWKQSSDDLLKRWQDSCSKLHPHLHSSAVPVAPKRHEALPVTPALPLPPKLTITGSIPTLQRAASPPGSPVKTDLVLGQTKALSATASKIHLDRVKDSAGCVQDKAVPGISELDSFKSLFYGLAERVEWQPEAASAIAAAVVKCKSGDGKQKANGAKGGTWLLFAGSDKVGKRKMAAALSELMFSSPPITVMLAGASLMDVDYGESDAILRGRTSLDRVAEALCRNPLSLIFMEDVDHADAIVRSTLKRAMERGRLTDSHGRAVSSGSAIFVLTTGVLPEDLKSYIDPSLVQYEEKILNSASNGWQLEFSILEREGKHIEAQWLCSNERSAKKSRKGSPPGLSLDLNLAIGTQDDDGFAGEGSRNSSDLTVEHEQPLIKCLAAKTLPPRADLDLHRLVDEAVLFQPVDFTPVKRKVTESITSKFVEIMGREHSLRFDDCALDRIMAALWLSGAGVQCNGLEEWAEKVLVPGIHQLKPFLKATAGPVTAQLLANKGRSRDSTELLPAAVGFAVNVL